ncbi:hypothetical protein COOONC_13401 [Cooperia oncophora]
MLRSCLEPFQCLRQKPSTTARELPSEATELVSAQKPQDYAPSRISSEKTTEIMIKRTMERTVTEEDLHTAEPVRTPAGLEDAGCKTASLPEPVSTCCTFRRCLSYAVTFVALGTND